MKKSTAIFISTFLLCMILMAGCDVREVSSTSAQKSTATATAMPTSTTATTTPIKSVISPTATIDTVLTQDTLFEEANFSIVIPKDATFKKSGTIDTWTMTFKGSVLAVMIGTKAENITTSYFTNSEANINTSISAFETGADNLIKVESGYKKTTIDNKTAIMLTGKYIKNASGLVHVYYVDTSKGLVTIVIAKALYTSDTTVPQEMDTTLEAILSSIKFK